MKRIVFSQHAVDKIEILKKHKIFIDKELIENAILNPDSIDSGYKGRFVAQKMLDENHVLRIVYEESEESVRVITMYPGRRKRYEKDYL